MRFLVLLSVVLALPSFLRAAPQMAAPAAEDYSGMYSFLREGEFVQITIEDKGAVSGFISRFGEARGQQVELHHRKCSRDLVYVRRRFAPRIRQETGGRSLLCGARNSNSL